MNSPVYVNWIINELFFPNWELNYLLSKMKKIYNELNGLKNVVYFITIEIRIRISNA